MPRWLAMALTHQVRRLGAARQARRHDRRQRPRLRQHELGGRSPAPSLRPHLGVAPTLVPARAEARCARQPGRPAVPGAVSVYTHGPRDAYGARGTDTVVGARPCVILVLRNSGLTHVHWGRCFRPSTTSHLDASHIESLGYSDVGVCVHFSFNLFRLFRSSLFETKGRTCKRGTVQLARTRDSPRAKQSYTGNFHRPSHRAHRHFPEVIADVIHRVVDR